MRYRRDEHGPFIITILLGEVEQEQFTLPAGDAQYGDPPPLRVQWVYDFYNLSDQDRRDKHQGRFENYFLARREEERNKPPADDDDDELAVSV